jgi:hypothetical protein
MAVRGIWTATAEVLCLSCHGRRTWHNRPVPADESWLHRDDPVRADFDEAETHCDRCGRAIIVGAGIAVIHEVRNALHAAGIRGAVMEQTGGMFAAVLVPAAHGARVQVYSEEETPGASYVIARAERIDSEETVVATVRGTAAVVAAVRRALAQEP